MRIIYGNAPLIYGNIQLNGRCLLHRHERIQARESQIQHRCVATIGRGCDTLRRRSGQSGRRQAQYCLHAYGQLGLRRTRRLRRWHPSRCAHAAYRQARKRRHAAAQLQCRGSVHAQSVGAHDGPLSHPLWHIQSPDWRHLGSAEARFPTHQGFDEWYGIPRTYDEAMWPSLNETNSMWPSVGNKQGWNANVVSPEYIYEAHKDEKARQVAELNVARRRTMEAEITSHAVDFIKRNANAAKPFYAYVSFSLVHFPTLPNPEFVGKTGNGDWADCLAEMDYRTGQILDAIKEACIEDNTIVIFASDNGSEATHPWDGDSGPWRGTYFTAMEASLRAPFIIRWPGKVPAGAVSNEIVHVVDLYPTLARVGGAELPNDRPIDGVDQLDFFLGKQEHSNREGFPAYVGDRLSAVKWRNWKVHFIWQENMYDPPLTLPLPKVINLLTDLKEERDGFPWYNSWVLAPVTKIVDEFLESLKKYPPIKLGTPDPYSPPK